MPPDNWSKLLRTAVISTVLAASASCGGGPDRPKATGSAYKVSAATLSGLGQALVDGKGFTLYIFVPDKQGASTCYGACAVQWPPLVLPSGITRPETGPGADEELLGTVQRSDGSVQITYNHWPLYIWFGDTSPGMHTGEGLNNLGGIWYVLSPNGIPIRH